MKFKDMPYERIDLEKVKKEFLILIDELKAAKSGEEQFEIHKKYYKLLGNIMTNQTLVEIRNSIDVTDEFYEKELEYCDKIAPEINNLKVAYSKVLLKSPYRDYLEKKIGKVAFKNIEISMKANDEKLIPLMQKENALVSEYNKIIATAKIDWEGEELNLSLLEKYLRHQDRSIRKKAYEKYAGFFEDNKNELDRIYDELVENRTEQAKMLGYDNFLELGYYRMNRNCYDKEMVENFRNQIKEYFVPFAEKLHNRRRERLGLKKLEYYDEFVYFQNGNPSPIGTPEEIMKAGQKMYSELSPETKEFFDYMTDRELFDVLGRKTKRAGGFMTYLPDFKSPFIFANFNSTSGDVDVMTHECGHAFQGYISGKDPIMEHSDITSETAEVHSMAMEFFTEPWMKLFFGDRTEDYVSMHLEDAAAFIPYGCMVDEFQHIVYENPQLTPDERNAAWKRLNEEYKPHLDFTGCIRFEEGAFWQKQLHIYNYPLYYIDYCLAQTCAFQYKVKMDEDYKAAWDSYLKLCELSASGFFTDMLKEVGLKSPFEDGCIKDIVEKLEKIIEL